MCRSRRTDAWSLLVAWVAAGGCGGPAPEPIALTCGEKHACVLRDDGSMQCWGVWTGTSDTPPSKPGPFSALAAGFFLCGLSVDGTISCWGHDGELRAPEGVFVELSGGRQRVCGLTSDGEAQCREVNRVTQPNDPPPSPEPLRLVRVGWGGPCGLRLQDDFPLCWNGSPTVPPPAEPLQELSVGAEHGCGIRSDRTLMCWGLPGGTPEALVPPPGEFVDVKTYDSGSCAMDANGSITCWGAWWSHSPPDFGEPPGTFDDFCVGNGFGCGFRPDRTIECWGFDDAGQSSPPDDL